MSASTDKELYKLELLSLVSRVSQELFNHTKLQDKTLAEFVIAVSVTTAHFPHGSRLLIHQQLHESSKTFDTFQSKLGNIGADFPPWFVKNLDRLIVTMHPKYKRKAAKLKAAKAMGNGAGHGDQEKEVKARKFPGLSMPDQEWRPAEAYMDTGKQPESENLPASISVEDTLSELAAVAARRNRPAAEDFLEGEPDRKRVRGEEKKQGEFGGYARDNGYGSRRSQLDYHDRGRAGRPQVDERPVLYKIYDGVVSNVRDFGAFVQLEGVQGRTEGMPSC